MLLPVLLLFTQLGTEILVNDDTCGGAPQQYPRVVADESGSFYSIWTDYRANDYDSDVYLQKIDRQGNMIGSNRNLTVDQPSRNIWSFTTDASDIAIAGSHIVLVTVDRRRGDFDIYVQLFDHELQPLTALLLVNDDGPGAMQAAPRVCIAGQNCAVVWEDWREGTVTVYGQVLDAGLRPVTGNFRVSEITGLTQHHPVVAGHSSGFIVAWQQHDQDTNRIYGRCFSHCGEPLGSSIRLFAEAMANPCCAPAARGKFWIGGERDDVPSREVCLVQLDIARGQVTGPFVVSQSPIADWQRLPTIASNSSSAALLIVWVDTRVSPAAIFGQWLDSLGNRLDTNFQISRASWLTTPSVAITNQNCYLVVWEDSRHRNQDIYGYHPQQAEFQLNDDGPSAIQDFPCVQIDENGNSLLVWFDERCGFHNADIYGQRFDSLAQPTGGNFRITDDPEGYQQHFPWVIMNSRGDAVVVWRDGRLGLWTVFGQRFDSQGQPIGTNFQISDTAGWSCLFPHGSMNNSGDLIVGWSEVNDARYQLFRRDGSRVGDNQRLAAPSTWPVFYLAEDRSFWAAWQQAACRLLLQRFDSLCRPLTEELLVTQSAGVINTPALLYDGDAGVIWLSWVDSRFGADEIFARLLDTNGLPLTDVFKVNDDNIPCEHLFPCLALGQEQVHVTFTDFRVEGDLNVVTQAFDRQGHRIGANRTVNTDPYPFVHQWAYQTVAARGNLVAYCWEDNRNLRSWDIYFKLLSALEITNDERSNFLLSQPHATVIPKGKHIPLPVASGEATLVRFFDLSGRKVKQLLCRPGEPHLSISSSDLAAGVYFLVAESRQKKQTVKLLVVE